MGQTTLGPGPTGDNGRRGEIWRESGARCRAQGAESLGGALGWWALGCSAAVEHAGTRSAWCSAFSGSRLLPASVVHKTWERAFVHLQVGVTSYCAAACGLWLLCCPAQLPAGLPAHLVLRLRSLSRPTNLPTAGPREVVVRPCLTCFLVLVSLMCLRLWICRGAVSSGLWAPHSRGVSSVTHGHVVVPMCSPFRATSLRQVSTQNLAVPSAACGMTWAAADGPLEHGACGVCSELLTSDCLHDQARVHAGGGCQPRVSIADANHR